ncbi:MAG: dephospho-CoA kinase [Phycisphaeraceae bacterium]|nr:MAG: dephospho-CoA kinase [Phycisphaeraceae bacterium]
MSRQPSQQPGTRPVVIGLAGGVASGKSAAAEAFAALGCRVLDSDREAGRLLQTPAVRDELVRWWGPGVLDAEGRIDHRAVGAIVFTDPDQRKRLEGLIHPLVIEAHDRDIHQAAADGIPAVVIDAPLLFEAGLDARCDAVVFLDTPQEQRVRRAAETRGWDEQELIRREKNQLPLENKRRRSHYTVTNDAERSKLFGQIREVFRAIMSNV